MIQGVSRMGQFAFTEEAQEYIKKKGGVAHVVIYRRSSMCCGRVALPPTINIGVPKNIQDYEVDRVNDIEFYYPKDQCFPHPWEINLHRTLGFSSLQVEGWKIF
jgi:hypothetical protein